MANGMGANGTSWEQTTLVSWGLLVGCSNQNTPWPAGSAYTVPYFGDFNGDGLVDAVLGYYPPSKRLIEKLPPRRKSPPAPNSRANAVERIQLTEQGRAAVRASAELAERTLLRAMAFQVRLRSELFIDEAGQPFIWITPSGGKRKPKE